MKKENLKERKTNEQVDEMSKDSMIDINDSMKVNPDGSIALEQENELMAQKHFRVKKKKFALPQWGVAWIALIPALIFIILFMVYPIINTFIIAFVDNFRWVDGAGSFALSSISEAFSVGTYQIVDNIARSYVLPSFGFGNFVTVLSDLTFLRCIWNTFEIVIISVPLTIIISLLIAVALNSIKKLRGLYQTIFFLPYVTNTIALGMVFNVLFAAGSGGLINSLLLSCFGWAGFSPVDWLNQSRSTMGVVIIAYSVWNGLAFKILVFMGGLATIDKQYYDAAKIDGSSRTTIFRRITVPLLSPQIFYIMITSFIGAFKAYTGVRAVFQNASPYFFGGIDGTEWMTVVGWIYKEMKVTHITLPGAAAAGSIVLLVIILMITIVQFAVSKTRVHY